MKDKKDLIYPELSYKIVGLLYAVHNHFGGGLREKSYEKALEIAFKESGIAYKSQMNVPLKFRGVKVADRFADFLVEDKIILELKSGERFTAEFIKQISEYLKESKLKLGLLVNFGKERVTIKRVVNDY